jgi:tol-pal system protein YbgF
VAAGVAKSDPEAGFVNDDSVQTYRKAMVYYQAKRYSDAAMVFSTFVEKYPDHPLAGSAQYFVGDSYFKQGEYKLALVEFKKVLTSYDRSAQVAQTLRQMAEAEDALKKPEEAARHRQLLMSLFPQSPATVFQQSRNETGQPAPAGATPATPDSTTESAASGARANPEQGTPPPTAPIGNAEAPAGGTTTSEAAR